jgi:hypothetical protein
MSVTTILSGGRSAISLKYENTTVPVSQSVVPWVSPSTLTFTALRYTLDSTDKAVGTVVGSSTVGPTDLSIYTTTRNNNPSAPTIIYRQVTSVTSQRAVRYNPLETVRKTIVVNSGTVPYNMTQLRLRDSTVTMVEFQASRTIDSAVAPNGGGNVVVSPAEKQVWY